MNQSFRWQTGLLIGLIAIAPWLAANADQASVERLRATFASNDLEGFVRELNAGALDPGVFANDTNAYDVACRSTFPDREPFLKALLAFGVNPSTEDPDGLRYTFSLLTCAYTEYGPNAFDLLLDAGANSNISVCPDCPDSWHTLVAHIMTHPVMFDMLTERRELTPLELDSVALRVSRIYLHKTWKGQPTNEYYADYLRERGYEVTPKGRHTDADRD